MLVHFFGLVMQNMSILYSEEVPDEPSHYFSNHEPCRMKSIMNPGIVKWSGNNKVVIIMVTCTFHISC